MSISKKLKTSLYISCIYIFLQLYNNFVILKLIYKSIFSQDYIDRLPMSVRLVLKISRNLKSKATSLFNIVII